MSMTTSVRVPPTACVGMPSGQLGTPTGTSAMPLEARLEVLGRAIDAMTGFQQALDKAAPGQLASILGILDRLASLAEAGRVAVTARASRSDGPAGSRAAGVGAWVRQHAPSQRGSGSGVLAKAAWLVGQPDMAPIADAVLDGQVSPRAALSVLNQYDRIRPRLADPISAPAVLDALVQAAKEGTRRLADTVPELLERFGGTEAVQADQDDAAARVALSRGVDGRDGTTCYELVADAVSRATLEAAIGPLSRPQPSPDGTPDARSAEHRRGQALFEVCRRVSHTAAAFTGAPSSSPEQPSSPNGEPTAQPSPNSTSGSPPGVASDSAPTARPAGSAEPSANRAPTEGARNAVPEVDRAANGKARSTQSAWAESKGPVPSCVSEVPVGVRGACCS